MAADGTAAGGGGAGASSPPAGMHFVVAVDGSPGAVNAFEFASLLAHVKRGDRLTVVHVSGEGRVSTMALWHLWPSRM